MVDKKMTIKLNIYLLSEYGYMQFGAQSTDSPIS